MPKDLTDEVDAFVSERSRSTFICNAVREKLIREKQVKALEKLKSSPFRGGPKVWEGDSAAWVRRLRRDSEDARKSIRKKNN
jgi:hypothetical protein